jgi:cobalt-zinc-cadmium efflux system membrane fusion protein
MVDHREKGILSRSSSVPLVLIGILVGLVVGVPGGRLIPDAQRAPEVVPPSVAAVTEAPPILRRIGDRIVVPPDSPLRTRLVAEEPAMKEVSRTLVLPALVEADPIRTVKVLPPVAGRVIDLKVQLGARVAHGQELAVIDSSDLAQAFADEEKARSALKLTKQTLDRLMILERNSAISVKEREQAQSDYAQALAELDRAESRLRAIGVPADQKERSRLLSLKAPITGSVIDLQVAPGAFLNDPTAAIMTLANLDTIWVTANVPEKEISFVFNGQDVNIAFASYPDKVFNGKVLFVSDVIEPDTRRTKVRIELNNPNKALKPNMFANATFVAPSVASVVVPSSALLMTNDKTSVFVEVAEWTFERRNVEIAYQDGSTAVIKSGIQQGERVVVRGAVRLND